ncbi:sugar ABC transporter ATP-binding protein [Sphingomonas oleivorans]|uniref:Sugar ABC transporter ATP-binding protein n=1 Tax=Sphingomonas oleivorans TaxID=1735121 RepID=A0A2T5FVK5_9SPHN|nr:sn-glycerol-3-phosphate ABC transporter ATP-binding protein UgpC [Sphingomonas oleivorans]PTQ09800.1 sugar ABC transporter ATP-binding protein [Sphingomonas oleivorans]
MASIKLANISKSLGRNDILRGIDLDIGSGEFIVFVGPSGCGKSTLLRLIAGLDEITSGELLIDGVLANGMSPSDRRVAMVFQSYALYPHMTVRENMSFSLKNARMDKREIEKRVQEAARSLDLAGHLDRLPKQLSGGQRQRVAIGRAIVREPGLFLFDEPLSNLDAALRVQTRIEIARLHKSLKTTMIYVTHDQVEAMTLADRIVVLNAGRIEQVGSPLDLYNRPANLFVAGFIGSPQMNFISLSTTGPGASREMVLGIRPEHLSISRDEQYLASFAGKIEFIENLGEQVLIYVNIGQDRPLVAKVSPDEDFALGQHVALKMEHGRAHYFDGESGMRLEREAGHG